MKGLHDFWAEVKQYADVEEVHRAMDARFRDRVDKLPWLAEHRNFVEQHAWGFGERSFHWLWKLLVDEMPPHFRFLEIGVYRGQVVSLIPLCAGKVKKTCEVTGVSPLSPFAGDTFTPQYIDTDYEADIHAICDRFAVQRPILIRGSSTDLSVQAQVGLRGPFDLVYIDGCHDYAYVVKDLEYYRDFVKPGGFLVMDDASSDLNLWWGAFRGIADVGRAVKDVLDPDPRFFHWLAVVHNRVWQRQW